MLFFLTQVVFCLVFELELVQGLNQLETAAITNSVLINFLGIAFSDKEGIKIGKEIVDSLF